MGMAEPRREHVASQSLGTSLGGSLSGPDRDYAGTQQEDIAAFQ